MRPVTKDDIRSLVGSYVLVRFIDGEEVDGDLTILSSERPVFCLRERQKKREHHFTTPSVLHIHPLSV